MTSLLSSPWTGWLAWGGTLDSYFCGTIMSQTCLILLSILIWEIREKQLRAPLQRVPSANVRIVKGPHRSGTWQRFRQQELIWNRKQSSWKWEREKKKSKQKPGCVNGSDPERRSHGRLCCELCQDTLFTFLFWILCYCILMIWVFISCIQKALIYIDCAVEIVFSHSHLEDSPHFVPTAWSVSSVVYGDINLTHFFGPCSSLPFHAVLLWWLSHFFGVRLPWNSCGVCNLDPSVYMWHVMSWWSLSDGGHGLSRATITSWYLGDTMGCAEWMMQVLGHFLGHCF